MAKRARDREALIDQMIDEYQTKRLSYEEFSDRCRILIEELLNRAGVHVLSVTCRGKDPASLREKLGRQDKDYAHLVEVTDLAGLRVITYMADEVENVASLIEREFKIVPEHSFDQSQLLDPDRFGYISLHYVCKLKPRRVSLSEWKPYKGLFFEIQVRSILQHAWAEIEHDLGYKTTLAIPKAHRRRFSRLAALLEVADDEFTKLKDDLEAYALHVYQQITRDSSTVLLDRVSFVAFVRNDPVVTALDQQLAAIDEAELIGPEDDWAGWCVAALQFVGLNTIRDVELALRDRETLLVEQFQRRGPREEHIQLNHGISLFQLWQVISAELGDPARVAEAWQAFNGGEGELLEQEWMNELIGVVSELTAANGVGVKGKGRKKARS